MSIKIKIKESTNAQSTSEYLYIFYCWDSQLENENKFFAR